MRRRDRAALLALGMVLAGVIPGCNSGTDITVIDPGKVELPPPPKQLDARKAASRVPSGGGSMGVLPSDYTKLPPR